MHDRMGSRNFPQRPSKHTLVRTSKVSTAGPLHLHTCMLPTSSHISDRKVPRLTEKVQPHICDLHEAHFRMTKPPTKTKTPASDARAKADSPDSSHRAYRSSPDAQSRRTSVYSDESSTSVLPQRTQRPVHVENFLTRKQAIAQNSSFLPCQPGAADDKTHHSPAR